MVLVDAPDSDPVRWLLAILCADRSTREPADGPGRVVCELAVVPSARRARFLLPVRPARVAAASLTAYNGLRPPRVAAARAVLAAGVRVGAGRALRHRVTIRASAAGGDEELATSWLPEHLRQVLALEELHVAVGLSPEGPFAKPTLQLFDGAGRPVGYAKLGWNAATRATVAREAEVLHGWPPTPSVVVPLPLHSGHWHDRVLSVSAPLPPEVRRLPASRWPCVDGARTISESAPAGTHPVGEARWAAHARRAAEELHRLRPHVGALAAARRFEAVAEVPVPHGLAHGDWVPWNLAEVGGRLVAWDWEHALDDAPLGFDLVHWAYQQHVVLGGEPPPVGFDRAVVDAAPHLAALGLDARQREAVAAAHQLRLVVREGLPGGPGAERTS